MTEDIGRRKGGSDAAFLLFLLLVAVVDTGKLFPVRLGLLRLAAFSALAVSLWRERNAATEAGPYPVAVAGFVLLSLGHAFSSVYVWDSLQHALNIALAAVLLGWSYRTFRNDPDRSWEGVFLSVCAVAFLQSVVALWQRFADGSLRPRGTFDNTNFLAEFLAVAGLLC